MLLDQKLLFSDKGDMSASGDTYGANTVELPADQDLSGFTSVIVVVTGSFGGAGTTKIQLCSGDAADPTTVSQPVFEGLASELVAGKTIRVGITPGALNKYNRIKVNNSVAAAGGAITAYLGHAN